MVDFNGFDKGVIGKKLPADTTLNCIRKAELIDLLHLADENHRVLAEAYKIAVDTSKCNICPLHLDTRKAEDIKADERKRFAFWLINRIHRDSLQRVLSETKNFDIMGIDNILSIYEKEQKNG